MVRNEISLRVLNTLGKANVELATLESMSAEEILAIKGIGAVALVELQQYFTEIQEEEDVSLSSADKRGASEVRAKGEYLEALTHVFMERHTPKELVELMGKGYKATVNNELAEYLLSKFMLASKDERIDAYSSILRIIYRERINHANSHVAMASMVSELGNTLSTLAESFVASWGFRRSLNKVVGGGASKYNLLAQQLSVVLIDLLKVMKIIDIVKEQALESNHTINKIIVKSNEVRLHPTDDKNIVKLLMKEVGSPMAPYAMQWGKSTRLPDGTSLYGGHSMKYNAGLQPSHVMGVLNTIQRTAYTIVPQMADASHPIGRLVRAIARKYFNASSYNVFIAFLDDYVPGTRLYTTVSLTPDNARLIYNGFPIGLHVGRMSWILQLATQIHLTPSEADKLQTRIAAIESKRKVSGKEEMEKLHYMAALDSYANGQTTGVVTSNDFKGSGPLMQAILMKDLDGLLASIEYDGQLPSDPYTLVLDKIPALEVYIEELVNEGNNRTQAIAIIREWVKGHTQPLMYGSGERTSMEKAAEYGSRLTHAEFSKAFEQGLPWTVEILAIVKNWAKMLSKYASNDLTNVKYSHLSYANAFGANCTITPLSNHFENKFKLMGHNLSIPCKIIDMDQHRVKTVAAGSHGLDSSVLFMIHAMFGEDMYSIHDDFRCSIREEDRLQKVAIDTLQYFWEKDSILDNYIAQVFSVLNEEGSVGYRVGSYVPEVPSLDWSKVTRVLF